MYKYSTTNLGISNLGGRDCDQIKCNKIQKLRKNRNKTMNIPMCKIKSRANLFAWKQFKRRNGAECMTLGDMHGLFSCYAGIITINVAKQFNITNTNI